MQTELREVKITDIIVGKRFREKHTDIPELCDNIKEHGLIQPITLNKNLELCAGGRRYMACAMAQLEVIPCIIRTEEDSEIDLREVELLENAFRVDLTWPEQAKLVAHIDALKREKDPTWKGKDTAELLGKSAGGVSMDLQVAEALEKVPELAKCKTASDARKVLKTLERREDAAKQVVKHKEKVAQLPDFIKYADSHYNIGDAIQGMRDTAEDNPNSIISLIEIDPPYAIDIQNVKKAELTKDESSTDYNEIGEDKYKDFMAHTLTAAYECAGKDCWLILWHAFQWQPFLRDVLIATGFEVDPVPGIWVKGDEDSEGTGQTNQPDLYLARCYEPFLIARKGKPRIHSPGRSNVFNYKPVPPGQKYHITQRPIELMREILNTFASPNSVIMTPFLGSGVTLRAAYQCHMTGFGWELNEKNKPLFLHSIIEDRAAQKELNKMYHIKETEE